MNKTNTTQGTPRTDNPRIVEWFGPNGKVLQRVELASDRIHYRLTDHRQDVTYYSAQNYSLSTLLNILNR